MPQIKLRARATLGTVMASLREIRGMIAELSEKIFSPITCGAYCASTVCLREKRPIECNYTLRIRHSVYMAAVCCGCINLLTIMATEIGAEISPADLRFTILHAESLTFAATFENWVNSSFWPL